MVNKDNNYPEIKHNGNCSACTMYHSFTVREACDVISSEGHHPFLCGAKNALSRPSTTHGGHVTTRKEGRIQGTVVPNWSQLE